MFIQILLILTKIHLNVIISIMFMNAKIVSSYLMIKRWSLVKQIMSCVTLTSCLIMYLVILSVFIIQLIIISKYFQMKLQRNLLLKENDKNIISWVNNPRDLYIILMSV